MEPACRRPDAQDQLVLLNEIQAPQWSRPMFGRVAGITFAYTHCVPLLQWSRPADGRMT
jgi:hypothetical protein